MADTLYRSTLAYPSGAAYGNGEQRLASSSDLRRGPLRDAVEATRAGTCLAGRQLVALRRQTSVVQLSPSKRSRAWRADVVYGRWVSLRRSIKRFPSTWASRVKSGSLPCCDRLRGTGFAADMSRGGSKVYITLSLVQSARSCYEGGTSAKKGEADRDAAAGFARRQDNVGLPCVTSSPLTDSR